MNRVFAFAMMLGCLGCASAFAESTPVGALARMPVKEVTVFKDGHALLLHAGKMPTNPDGAVVLDYLPAPVMGTFWSASTDPKIKLTGVTASQRRVTIERTPLTLREMIEAGVGKEVTIRETPENSTQPGAEYPATILGIPQRSVEELEAVSAPGLAPRLPEKSPLVLLKTPQGVRPIDPAKIASVTFKDGPGASVASEELRNLLTLKLQWPEGKREPQADVMMMYLQKGIRWIPQYKVTIDGKGQAVMQLQATLINELYDLQDVTANLVVGVPSFQFTNMQDPIGVQPPLPQAAALQQTAAQLSPAFRADSSTAFAFSNSIMSQVASPVQSTGGRGGAQPAAADLGPDITGGQKSEDFFIFTVNHLTLKRGDRMVVPVTEFKIEYKDVYVLDVPAPPPIDMWRRLDVNRQTDLARLMQAPKVTHVLRLSNSSANPITTAPALIVRDGKVLSEGMTMYTPSGGKLDLNLTTAVDVQVKKADHETGRIPNAMRWDTTNLSRVDIEGAVTLTNRLANAIDVEVRRNFFGTIDKTDNKGEFVAVTGADDDFMPAIVESGRPVWWSYYSWPSWWSRFNPLSVATWNVTLEPGKDVKLNCAWHYYW